MGGLYIWAPGVRDNEGHSIAIARFGYRSRYVCAVDHWQQLAAVSKTTLLHTGILNELHKIASM